MNLKELETNLQYQFNDIKLLELALTHRSYLNESSTNTSNERLEYLGDAVLELIISDFLYHQMPKDAEGRLTAARSAIVRTESLAQIAKKLNLGEFLFMSQGEEKTGGRENESLLANTTEAVTGSIFLDGGYQAVQTFINTHILPEAKKILQNNQLKDPKSLLQEKVQEKGYHAPKYETVEQTGPAHNRTFTVIVTVGGKALGKGTGKNKQTAQQKAAKKALIKAKTLAPIA